jgi:hypothetical protein
MQRRRSQIQQSTSPACRGFSRYVYAAALIPGCSTGASARRRHICRSTFICSCLFRGVLVASHILVFTCNFRPSYDFIFSVWDTFSNLGTNLYRSPRPCLALYRDDRQPASTTSAQQIASTSPSAAAPAGHLHTVRRKTASEDLRDLFCQAQSQSPSDAPLSYLTPSA